MTKGRFYLSIFVSALALSVAPTHAQNNFNSGSTGADGVFSPTTSQTILVPESGVFNYTTVNIPSGVTITYARNSRNSPVLILASGDITIAGVIRVDGKPGNANGAGGAGAPGGHNGGPAGYGVGTSFTGQTGNGHGGGIGGGSTDGSAVAGGGGGGFSIAGVNGSAQNTSVVAGQGGPRYGTNVLSPLIGGSGGGGGGARSNTNGGAGGGGGGAILIASSTKISFTGTINARGGEGGGAATYNSQGYAGGGGGGGGSGGGVRLVANTLTGTGTIDVRGGSAGLGYTIGVGYNANGGSGAPGYIRAEAYDYSSFTPAAQPSFVSFASPYPAVIQNAPQLRVASVAGVAAPPSPLGSLHAAPDIIVPPAETNPVAISLEAVNLPVGTVVQVTLTPATGTRTMVQSTPLSGTEAASTATATVTLPAGMSVITATAVVDLTTASHRPMFINGERIDRIEVAASYGGASQLTYITSSGRRLTFAQ